MAAVLTVAQPAAADDSSQQLWLISTRWAPRCCPLASGSQRIRYWRLQDNQWLKADADAFFESSDPQVPTTVFIHGNREDRNSAIRSASYLYGRIKRDSAGRPFRFVIWSWPSDRIRGRNRQDVRLKAYYSDVQAYYLAECLARIDPQVPVNLVGYSFGARTITGALHLLGGGQLAGWSLPSRPDPQQPAKRRAVLVGAALDACWLLPGYRNGLALSQVEQMLITRNCCDRVLRWYPLMYHRHGPQALGYVGPPWYVATDKVEVIDLTYSLGRSHEWFWYVQAPGLWQRFTWYSFLEEPLQDVSASGPLPSGTSPGA